MAVTTVTSKGNNSVASPAAKPSLSESQRTGAIERAHEAQAAVDRLSKAMPKDHQHAVLIARAASSVHSFAADAVVASGVADAQYASRKAIEAAAAAGWLFSQRV